MFSPLRIEKYHGKKIKLKDIDSRYLTCSTPPKNQPTNPSCTETIYHKQHSYPGVC